MSDVTLLRLGILIAGLILIGAIVFFGRPRRQEQGKRVPRESVADGFIRTEPTLSGQATGNDYVADNYDERASQPELALDAVETASASTSAASSDLGKRTDESFDKIVTLYLAARAGTKLHG